MSPGIVVRILRHGTTRHRADAILKNGPDPRFVEPGGTDSARGFSTCPEHGPFPCGTADEYAARKASLFPNEGGPAILEIEVPEDIVDLGIDAGGEIRFETGNGLDELLIAWPIIAKKVV